MPAKTISQLTQATTINGTDDFAIEQSGVTKRIAASVVRGDIVNANIKSDAAIAFSKLAPLNSAQILVGNGSNVPTAVSVTGDVTISNAGVTAIGSAKVLPAMLSQPYTLATAQASTSGTNIDFTGIPSWAKRITVMFNGVSTSGTSSYIIRVGTSSGIVLSGYISGDWSVTNAVASGVANSTTGFQFVSSGAGSVQQGTLVLVSVDSSSWIGHGMFYDNNPTVRISQIVGRITGLANALDRIRITTANGTDTFDGGSINIAYEG